MFATLIINGVMAQNSYNIPLKHVAYRTTEPLSIDGKGMRFLGKRHLLPTILLI